MHLGKQLHCSNALCRGICLIVRVSTLSIWPQARVCHFDRRHIAEVRELPERSR